MKRAMVVVFAVLASAAAAFGGWRTLPAPPVARVDAAAVVDDAGAVYLLGGSDRQRVYADVYKYDAAHGWRAVAPLPEALAQHAAYCLAGKIYVAGGYGAAGVVGDAFIYDISADRWTAGPALPAPTYGGRLAAAGARLFFLGGADATDQAQGACLEYSAGNNAWIVRAPMTQPRKHHAAAAWNGALYVFGGVANVKKASTYLTSVEYYDPDADAWHAVASLPVTFWGGVGGPVAGGLAACGGLQGDAPSSACWLFALGGSAWTPFAAAPFAGYRAAGGGPALAMVGGEIVLPRGHEIVASAALWSDSVDDDASPADDDASPADDDGSPADDDASPGDDDDNNDDNDDNDNDNDDSSPAPRHAGKNGGTNGCGC
jgi:hypothetical protein